MLRLILLTYSILLGTFVFSQFTTAIDFLPQSVSGVRALCMSDIDNDGDSDMLSASGGDNKIAWYENDNGAMHFQHVISISAFNATWVTAGDLDGDNDNDVVASSIGDDKIAWYKNLGNGEFSDEQIIGSPVQGANCLHLADLDNDGDLDLISSESATIDCVVWRENLGNGSFGAPVVLVYSMENFTQVTASDMDNDGWLDIISSSSDDDKIIWYKNLGGSFGSGITITNQADGTYSLFCGDLDGDTDPDILTGAMNDNLLLYIQNLGSGTFAPPVAVNTVMDQFYHVTAGDINGDGEKDILYSTYTTNQIGWQENLGGGAFGPSQVIETIDRVSSYIAMADLDNDSDIDLFSSSSENCLIALMNENPGFSRDTVLYSLANGERDVTDGDLNNDGYIDVVVAYGTLDTTLIVWYENLGGNLYKTPQFITANVSFVTRVCTKDIDGDGITDVIFSGQDDRITWCRNLGNNSFGPQQVIHSGTNANTPYDFVSTDLNNDGYNDIVAGLSSDEVCWFPNNGNGSFGAQINISTLADTPIDIHDQDLDNDGDIDLLSSSSTEDEIAWYENLGNGTFAAQEVLNTQALNPDIIYSDDLDNDGLADILFVSSGNSSIGWQKNLGNGNFTTPIFINTAITGPRGLRTGDLDNDGDKDLIALFTDSNDNAVIWHENTGGGSFSAANVLDAQTYFIYHTLLIHDKNNDGDVDILSPLSSMFPFFENHIFYSSQVQGIVFYDENLNGSFDSQEITFNASNVVSTPQSDFTFTLPNGRYFMEFSDTIGNYTIQPQPIPYWSVVTDSVSYNIHIDSNFQALDHRDFGFYPDTLITEISPNLIGGLPRCNTVINFWIDFHNTGTIVPSGLVMVKLDSNIQFIDAFPVPDSVSGQQIYWHYDSLLFFQNEHINLFALMPTFLSMGDTLTSYLSVNTLDSGGAEEFVFSDTLEQILTCAYDPNDKAVSPMGIGNEGYIPLSQEWLEYTVRFQNTGNDTALNVVIRDQLDPSLDWQSIQPLSMSYPATITGQQNGEVEFNFHNIHLPDSNVNELASHGYIKYRIKLKENLSNGTVIHNTANIYFDFNPAVVTNTTVNTLFDCSMDTIAISNLPTDICQNQLVDASQTANLNDSISWEISGITTQNGQNFNWLADSTGTFVLTITKENFLCAYQSSVLLNVHPISPLAFIDSLATCSGESIQIFGIAQNQEGTYYDTLQTIYGCDSIVGAHLEILPTPEITLNDFLQDTVCQQNGVISLPSATPLGGTYSGNGVSGSQFDPALAGAGTHFVYYSHVELNGCMALDSVAINVENCLGITEFNNLAVSVYPNPFSQSTTVQFNQELNGEYDLYIYNVLGEIVYTKNALTGKTQIIERSTISNGVYLLTITDRETDNVIQQKLVIE